MKQLLSISVLLFALFHCSAAQPPAAYDRLPTWPGEDRLTAFPENFVFWDATAQEIVISFPKDPQNPHGVRTTYRYRPQNQVDPQIVPEISFERDGNYHYRYTVSNGLAARQAIDIWSLVSPGVDADIRLEHAEWGKLRVSGSVAKQAALQPEAPHGEYIDWVSDGRSIGPGSVANGFLVVSSYRPGLTTAYAQGGKPLSAKEGMPPAAGRQLVPFMKLEVNNRVTVTIGPRFARNTPSGAIARDYAAGIRRLIIVGDMDASSQFVSVVLAALDACSGVEAERCASLPAAAIRDSAASVLEHQIAAALLLSIGPRQVE